MLVADTTSVGRFPPSAVDVLWYQAMDDIAIARKNIHADVAHFPGDNVLMGAEKHWKLPSRPGQTVGNVAKLTPPYFKLIYTKYKHDRWGGGCIYGA